MRRTLRVLAWRLTFKAVGLGSSIVSPNRTKNYPCFFFSFSTSNFSPRATLGNGFNTILFATHLFRCCHTTTYGQIILWCLHFSKTSIEDLYCDIQLMYLLLLYQTFVIYFVGFYILLSGWVLSYMLLGDLMLCHNMLSLSSVIMEIVDDILSHNSDFHDVSL